MSRMRKNFFRLLPILIVSKIILILFLYMLFLNYYEGKIFPGVKIASYNVSGQTPYAIQEQLAKEATTRANTPLKITFKDQELALNINSAGPKLDIESSINTAYTIGRSGNFLQDLEGQLKAIVFGIEITPNLTYKHSTLLIYEINAINQVIKEEPKNAKLVLGSEIILTPSENGYEIDNKVLFDQLNNYLKLKSPPPNSLPLKIIPAKFNTDDAQIAKKALENVKNNPIKLYYKAEGKTEEIIVDQIALFKILDLEGQTNSSLSNQSLDGNEVFGFMEAKNIQEKKAVINKNKLASFLQNVSAKVDQEVKEAKFIFDPETKKVNEFQSAQEGRKLDIEQTALLLTQVVTSGAPSEIDLPIQIIQPKTTTEDVNTFGIKELLGQGISNFAGSIENRIYNINLAASRINGTLVAPGETFSFNKTVGEISAASGYKQAYVIKEGRTVLDDGGGVCQVSTTLFRAVLNAGLPVVSRTAHAYRVSYYEQGFPPGLDATVFSPSVDFKFKNDTSAYILIQAYTKGTTLYFDLYGASDGRAVSLTTPKITNQTPPPPELKQEDPTLPRGTVKQVDWAAWGATVTFSRTVTRGRETLISETFRSNYRPWQAVYLVGTKD